MALTKADFLKPVLKEVKIEDMGDSIYFKRMTGAERNRYLNSLPRMESSDKEEIDKNYDALYESMLTLVSMTVCDEHGGRLFEDPKELYDIDSVVLEKLYLEAHKYNKLGTEDFKDAVKN